MKTSSAFEKQGFSVQFYANIFKKSKNKSGKQVVLGIVPWQHALISVQGVG